MTMYQCKLLDNKGYKIECFYRQADNKIDLINELESFQWPNGHWVITDVAFLDNDE